MTDILDSLVRQVQHLGWGRSAYPTKLVANGKGYFDLSMRSSLTSLPLGTHLLLPSDSDLKDTFDALLPPPPADIPGWEAVATRLEVALVSNSEELAPALQDLSRLLWGDVWLVLDRLDKGGPTSDGSTYLTLLQQVITGLPHAPARSTVAITAATIERAGALLTEELVPLFVVFSQALLTLDPNDQFEVMAHAGVPPDDVEGLIAMMESEVDAALLQDGGHVETFAGGAETSDAADIMPTTTPSWLSELLKMVQEIDTDDDSFKDWTMKKRGLYFAYLGTEAHSAIAEWYSVNHQHGMTFFNTASVDMIIDAFIDALQLKRGELGRVAKSLARARPDILEFALDEHGTPPGWLYEIKPAGNGAGAALALFEARFYAGVLSLCRIPVDLGPVLYDGTFTPGTRGVLPMPHGWVAFLAPVDGVIVYKYVKASRRAIEARGQVPVPSEVAKKVRDVLEKGPPEWLVYVGAAALVIMALLSRGRVRLQF